MPACKHCGSKNVIRRGYSKTGKIKIQCKEDQCKDNPYSLSEIDTSAPSSRKISAKILLFDIETSLMEVYVFGLRHNDYISPENIKKDWSVLTWSAKWLFEPEIMGAKVTGQEAIQREDTRILKPMWELLDEADIVIFQNGKKFDAPKLNARFVRAGFPPPMYYQAIDTKEVMSKNLGLSSNTLDYATDYFELGGKGEMVFDDWKRCSEGEEEYLHKMFEYNKNDVVIMEELYLKLRPWIPSHANLGVYADLDDKECCPNCQSIELQWVGQYATPLGLYEAFRCGSCGAIGRSTKKKYQIKKVDVRN